MSSPKIMNRWLVDSGSGKAYARPTSWATLETLHNEMQIQPVALGQFLLLAGLLIPVVGDGVVRRGDESGRVRETDGEVIKFQAKVRKGCTALSRIA